MKKLLSLGLIAMTLTSCDDVFEPLPENNLGLDHMYVNSTYAENILANVYIYMPFYGGYSFNDVATDDAVSNDASNSFRRMASGSWTSNSNPIGRWESCRSAIQYCNLFLDRVDKVKWAEDEEAAQYFHDRFVGEAHALRALHTFFLLQAHAGWDAQGNLLGIPIVEHGEDATSNFNVPRNTFAECLEALKKDAQIALQYLPTDYGSAYFDEVRALYPGISAAHLERVFGSKMCGRISGKVVEAIVARADLMAASPAFNTGSGVDWATAAESNAKVLDRIGGVEGMDETGGTWYCDPNIENLTSTSNPAEIIWRSEKSASTSLEEDNFPPTLYGKGRINPTQNLVDAFPMANGYPISDSRSGYSATNPYADRDPRLETYILFNGGTAGISNTAINTASDGTTNDALNKVSTSTRTGYYMKKLLRQDVNCDPNSKAGKHHYTARLRYTEFFLNYAEAANEAWGPQGKGNHGYSAYDVVKAIRQRALVGIENGDAYLESIKDNKEEMAKLIRNERRIELCFEGFRFFDLRRWNADLKEAAMGVNIAGGDADFFKVEDRNFADYMRFGPIPYSEVLKYSELQQNAGW